MPLIIKSNKLLGVLLSFCFPFLDLPLIISDDYCAFLEPQEQIWKGKSGKRFCLEKLQQFCPQTLLPYDGVSGFSMQSPSFANKTLFRFPLRCKASKLSNEIYDIKEILSLLQVIKAEAKYLLLFLRSVSSIEVIEISEDGCQPMFKVTVSSRHDLVQNQQQQQSLVEQVKANFACSFDNKVIQQKSQFQVEISDGRAVTAKHEWIVVHRIGSEDPEVLTLAEQQHVLPWVGTALEITPCHDNFGGRIFCFIPLPTEDRVPFSVHVNGTFAVNSNRRSLKWESQERQHDPEAIWNRYLVERCIPACYASLVAEIARIPSIAPEVVYNCWPVVSRVQSTPWEGALKNTYENLLYSNSAVYTTANDGQWISLANSVFVPEIEGPPECVKKALLMSGTKLVELNHEQWDGIKEFYKAECSISFVSPLMVRSVLKQNLNSYINQSTENKCAILQYCASDKNYSDLAGLKLIPLANSSFGDFHALSRQHTHLSNFYVCSPEIHWNLLPGLDHQMVDLLESDSVTHSLLTNIAESGNSQLMLLNQQKVASLLPYSNPQKWSDDQLENFWKWIQGYDLSVFEGADIVPVKGMNSLITLHSLSKQSSLIYLSPFSNVSQALREALELYGISFASALDFPYLNHPQLQSCVLQFNAGDVLDAMPSERISSVQLTDEQTFVLQTFLSEENINSKNIARVTKTREMRLFSVLNDDNTRYSINQLKTEEMGSRALVQGEEFYFRTDVLPDKPLIIQDSNKLPKNLSDHVLVINGIECLEKIVFPSIRSGYMSVTNMSKIMISVLVNLQTFIQRYPQSFGDSLICNLSSLPFVTVNTAGQHKSPSSLFDPESELLMKLYSEDPVFPSGEFIQYTNELRLCGLRGPNSMLASDVYKVVCNIKTNSNNVSIAQCDDITFVKAIGVLNFLEAYPHLLDEIVVVERRGCFENEKPLKAAIAELVETYPLLPIVNVQPTDYPSCLKWKGSIYPKSLTTFQPKNVIALSTTLNSCKLQPEPTIIGSEVVFVEHVPSALCDQLPKSHDELATAVVAHFKYVIEHESDIEAETLEQIAIQTYTFLGSCSENMVKLNSISNWMWIDSSLKFAEPKLCALNKNSSLKISLEPFVYVLPSKMRKYEKLLCGFGVNQCVTTEQIISVLENIKKRSREIVNDEAWSLVRFILEWIVNAQIEFSDILVPIEVDDEFPNLYSANEVLYTDNELLLEIVELSGDHVSYKLIHHSVGHLALQLGLTPLSDKLDITEDVFQDAGQHEPLVTRLSNILKEYKDGLTIIKEMIQNADDAEATEVNILYDARHHTTDKLLFKGMGESHGPALVIHNNAKFTEEDFINITKLAGGAKKDKPLKIGKFGIGFCSVYHITDVPSFVSDHWLYIFDPTLKHLKGIVKNENQPGKRVNYLSKFVSRTQQLTPYERLFGFNPSDAYNGTMFRFPFRKHASQISSTIYNEAVVKQLEEELMKKGREMLLFLSHVKKITFQSINSGDSAPEEVIVIQKTKCSDHIFQVHSSHLIQDSSEKETWLISSEKQNMDNTHATSISSVACQLSNKSGQYRLVPVDGSVFCFLPLSVPSTGLPVHVSANFAVMSNRSGIWTSASSSTQSDSRECWNKKLLETVIPAAYCKIIKMLKILSEKGELLEYDFFSLLPLVEKLSIKNPWEAMIKSLYSLLLTESIFYSRSKGQWLTPTESKFLSPDVLAKTSTEVPKCVPESINTLKLPVVYLPQQYFIQLKSSMEGHLKIFDQTEFCRTFFSMIESFDDNLKLRNEVIFNMFVTAASEVAVLKESELLSIFKNSPCIPCRPNGKKVDLVSNLVDPNSELSLLFNEDSEIFPIEDFTNHSPVYQVMLDIGLLTSHLPWNIILECAESILSVYEENATKALNRVRILIQLLERNFEKETVEHVSSSTHTSNDLCPTKDSYLEKLKRIGFIPTAKKPEGFFLPWKGENINFISPCEVFYPIIHFSSGYFKSQSIERECHLLGTQKVIANCLPPDKGGCGIIPQNVLNNLGILTEPSLDDVLRNYQCLIEGFSPELLKDNEKLKKIEYTCQLTYDFVNNELKRQQQNSSSFLPSAETIEQKQLIETEIALPDFPTKLLIWTGNCFVNPENIASNWKENGPILYRLPSIISEHGLLVKTLFIKEKFTINKLLSTLKEIKKQYEGIQLPESFQKTVDAILFEFNTYHPDDFVNICEEDIVLPSSSYALHFSKELYFNDSPWLPLDSDEVVLVHENLNRHTAIALKVNTVRSKFLDKYSKRNSKFGGVSFGQREELTQRIKNILRDYPFDVTFLKEFLQNAEDAKANKMCVIVDKRTHSSVRTPFEKAEELQGPSVLVWNNECFKKKDLEGIQKLGLGSKRDDPNSLGRFGIGFNVAYHLTDCPSFLTDSEGNKKILCVFDPHCRYIKGADLINPGECYEGLEDQFWNAMSDLRSAYLQNDPVHNQPPDLKRGSLFRFPLRHTRSIVRQSEITQEKLGQTAEDIEKKFDEWVPQIKDALIFLHNIREFSYYVIDEDGFHLKIRYEIKLEHLDGSNMENCSDVVKHIQSFRKNRKPDVFNYYLIIKSENRCISSSTESEKWFVQQGIGDLDKDRSQKWHFSKDMLPKHGMATICDDSCTLKGRIFCFLPLPVLTGLPVHINGQFVLGSDRRSLWGNDAEVNDEKKRWNVLLFEAIASSYVHFLLEARRVFVKDEYEQNQELLEDVQQYYNLYPFWYINGSMHDQKQPVLDSHFKRLAELVFCKLRCFNEDILAIIEDTNIFKVEWHPLKNDESHIDQVYFQLAIEKEMVISLLTNINMKLTVAPNKLYEHLCSEELHVEENEPFIAIPESVFQFYCNFHKFIFLNNIPCPVEKSPFKSELNFCQFIDYLCSGTSDSSKKVFPQSPFNYPLLLTVDGYIRCFDKEKKVFKTRFSFLFPKSLQSFLHVDYPALCASASYYCLSKDIEFDEINHLLADNYPHELRQIECYNLDDCVLKADRLKELWKCLCDVKDVFLKKHQMEVLNNWALIPATNKHLYRANSEVSPVSILEPNLLDVEVLDILFKIGLPILDCLALPNEAIAHAIVYCSMNYNRIVQMLFSLQQRKGVLNNLSLNEAGHILSYLFYLSYRPFFSHDDTLKEKIKKLPLFQSFEGKLTDLQGKKVYLWPQDGFCESGYCKWASPDVVFLKYDGNWRKLTNNFNEIGRIMDVKDIYLELIFSKFSQLSTEVRHSHLLYIRDNVYQKAKQDSSEYPKSSPFSSKKYFEMLENAYYTAKAFLKKLKELECIKCSKTGDIKAVHEFCDHTVPIFQIFSECYSFLSEEYRDDEWMAFFHELGLRVAVTIPEFIDFCSQVSRGNSNYNLEEASEILLTYLCNMDKEWEYSSLQEIAGISFVIVDKLPQHNWMRQPCPSPHVESGIGLTELKQAVLPQYTDLVWTVVPVIKLPEKNNNLQSDSYELLSKFTITPSLKDVIQNLKNISDCGLSDFELFHTYDPRFVYKETRAHISAVVYKIMDFLLENLEECKNLQLLPELKRIACIPVPAKYENGDSKPDKVVLVKPTCVVKHFISSLDEFLSPYIHKVPVCLQRLYPLLEEIGVLDSVELIHIKNLLEVLHSRIGSSIADPNQVRTVRHAVVKLGELIKHTNNTQQKISEMLKPLYLPTTDIMNHWTLKESTKLVFADCAKYRTSDLRKFNFTLTPFSLFSIPPDFAWIAQHYELNTELEELNICLCLPEVLRPQELSFCTKEKRMPNTGHDSNDPNIILASLNEMKKFIPHIEEKILPSMLKHHMPHHASPKKFVSALVYTLSKLEISVIDGLQASVYVDETEIGRLIDGLQASVYVGETEIGRLSNPRFVLEKVQDRYALYLDVGTTPEYEFWAELSRSLLIEIARSIKCSQLGEFLAMIEPVKSCLQVQSYTALRLLGEKYKINIQSISEDPGNKVDEVPSVSHIGSPILRGGFTENRLFKDENNVFHTQEMVGYGITEDIHLVRWAMILSSEGASKYKVLLGKGDEKVVPISQLYKIVAEDKKKSRSDIDS